MTQMSPHGGGWDASWRRRAACVHVEPEAMFVQGKEQRAARVVCRDCPVSLECLAEALDARAEFGVWGGMTERERRALLRARPEVKSWTALFAATRDEELAG